MIGIYKNSLLCITTRHVASYECKGMSSYGLLPHFHLSQLAIWRIMVQNYAFLCIINITQKEKSQKKKKRKKRKIPLTLFMSSYATLVVIFGFGESHIRRKAFLFMPYKG